MHRLPILKFEKLKCEPVLFFCEHLLKKNLTFPIIIQTISSEKKLIVALFWLLAEILTGLFTQSGNKQEGDNNE